jgi:hypothetical protein
MSPGNSGVALPAQAAAAAKPVPKKPVTSEERKAAVRAALSGEPFRGDYIYHPDMLAAIDALIDTLS